MPAQGSVQKGTRQFMRQGHTEVNAFGAATNRQGQGVAGTDPKEIKP
jgi:hypothetical protein